MPFIPPAPGSSPVTPYLFTVPYPAAAGTAGPAINVGTFLSAGSQVRQGPAIGDYSDAWIEIINYSDSMLALKWDQGSMEPFIPPGQMWSGRIPVSAGTLFTTIVFQSATQFFANELLLATFYTNHDLESGYRPRIGPLVPSIPAAAIGAGALPESVFIGADNVTAETFVPGVILPAAQVGAGTLSASVSETVINSDAGAITSDGGGNLGVTGNLFFGPIVSASEALLRYVIAANAVQLLTPQGGATPLGIILNVWNGAGAGLNVASFGGQFGGAPFWTGEIGNIGSVGGQACVGALGVPPFVAQNPGQTVTTTGAQTVLSYAPPTGWYRANATFSWSNTVNSNVSLILKFRDPNGGAGITQVPFERADNLALLSAQGFFAPGPSTVVCVPLTFNALTGTNITIVYTDSAGVPNVVVSTFLERLA